MITEIAKFKSYSSLHLYSRD